jgi:hypothetical protein
MVLRVGFAYRLGAICSVGDLAMFHLLKGRNVGI